MAEPAQREVPREILLRQAEKMLVVVFEDGARFELPAEYLRVESPSAEVQGHGPGQKVLVTGRGAVGIMRVEPVGNYAARLIFDDLHETGIYSWPYLRQLGEEYAERRAAYAAAVLAAAAAAKPPRAT